MTTEEIIPPWYKQFWPWFLIAIPVITVISGISMVLIASHKPDGMVVDDYYKTGLAINRTLKRDEVASKLNLSAKGNMDITAQSVQVFLTGQQQPLRLKLILTHPTASQQDIIIALQRQNKQGMYSGFFSQQPAGKRYLLLEPLDKSWRLTGSTYFGKDKDWQLKPIL
ncbi:MAG: FixH family protein [Gammaproteobacteria bacterium]|nr:FixH family protein [Gammaproteobacteria bacterium]MDH5778265.1 FixH family protein [Gammaproteobacteria bacterium]